MPDYYRPPQVIKTQDSYPHIHSEPIALDSVEGIILAIEKMDIVTLEKAILAGLLYSPDMSNESLITKLKSQFSYLKSTGNIQLRILKGKCAGACNKGIGYSFEGNVTGSRLNYIIKSKRRRLRRRIEIQQCICFQVDGEPTPDPF